MKINRIAVCMYGQYRTGLELSSTIANYFEIPNKQVDFFCSVKLYNRYYSASKEQSQDYIDDEQTVMNIKDDVIRKYNPKLTNFITLNADSLNLENSQHGTYSAIIDSFHLKQKYECEHKFQYDLVITFRYDTIMYPVDYFKKLITILETNIDINGNVFFESPKNEFQNFMLVKIDSIFAAGPIENLPHIGDMCFVCNSETADFLYSELILCQSEKHHFNSKLNTMINTKVKFYNQLGHFKWAMMFNSLSIPYKEFPPVSYEKNSDITKLILVPVRNSNLNKKDDYTDLNVIHRHGIYWGKNTITKLENS